MTGFEMSEEEFELCEYSEKKEHNEKVRELEDDEKRKQEIFEKVYCELGDVMDCDDEAIMERFPFEFNL